MAAQLGIEALGARKTVAKINDPVRAEAYAHLGIATLCRTNLMTAQILGYPGQAVPARPGIYVPEHPHQHDAPVAATAARRRRRPLRPPRARRPRRCSCWWWAAARSGTT